MPSDFGLQREIVRVGLDAAQGEGFALAGSGAIREHGLTQRPTQDVDLFTVMLPEDPQAFGRGVAAAVDAWQEAGYEVLSARQSEGFANFVVITAEGRSVEVDMGIDWRALDPVQMEVGPVLSVEDAIGGEGSLLSSALPAVAVFGAIVAAGSLTRRRRAANFSDSEAGAEADWNAAGNSASVTTGLVAVAVGTTWMAVTNNMGGLCALVDVAVVMIIAFWVRRRVAA